MARPRRFRLHPFVHGACVALLAAVIASMPAPAGAQMPTELRWGGDAEGGSPFVEADPDDLTRVVGFEVEVAALLADGLGRVPRFVQVGFTSLDAAVARGDFDIGLSGIEDHWRRLTCWSRLNTAWIRRRCW
jgi:polar amino acid transport system substrate-binding protein